MQIVSVMFTLELNASCQVWSIREKIEGWCSGEGLRYQLRPAAERFSDCITMWVFITFSLQLMLTVFWGADFTRQFRQIFNLCSQAPESRPLYVHLTSIIVRLLSAVYMGSYLYLLVCIRIWKPASHYWEAVSLGSVFPFHLFSWHESNWTCYHSIVEDSIAHSHVLSRLNRRDKQGESHVCPSLNFLVTRVLFVSFSLPFVIALPCLRIVRSWCMSCITDNLFLYLSTF